MVKARLKEKFKAISAFNSDINEYRREFNKLLFKLRNLKKAINARCFALEKLMKARAKTTKLVGDLSEKTPLGECVAKAHSDYSWTYSALHKDIEKRTHAYIYNFFQDVVKYIDDWETVVKKRGSENLTQLEDVSIEVDHYEGKVKSLQSKISELEWREKPMDDLITEKLERNTYKLGIAKGTYEDVNFNVSNFIKEVTEQAWKDVYPAILKTIQLEKSFFDDMAGFSEVLETEIIPRIDSHGDAILETTYSNISPLIYQDGLANFKSSVVSSTYDESTHDVENTYLLSKSSSSEVFECSSLGSVQMLPTKNEVTRNTLPAIEEDRDESVCRTNCMPGVSALTGLACGTPYAAVSNEVSTKSNDKQLSETSPETCTRTPTSNDNFSWKRSPPAQNAALSHQGSRPVNPQLRAVSPQSKARPSSPEPFNLPVLRSRSSKNRKGKCISPVGLPEEREESCSSHVGTVTSTQGSPILNHSVSDWEHTADMSSICEDESATKTTLELADNAFFNNPCAGIRTKMSNLFFCSNTCI